MKLIRFFIFYALMFFIECILVGITHQPTIQLVTISALTMIMLYQLPWYANFYILCGISLSAFLHNFSIPLDGIRIVLVIMSMNFYFHNVLIHHSIAQSCMIITLSLAFMMLDCYSCLTIGNILTTILITPAMLQFLR